jgi:hypothetical protein
MYLSKTRCSIICMVNYGSYMYTWEFGGCYIIVYGQDPDGNSSFEH